MKKKPGPQPMKQAFIPLFQDIRTSSLWALDASTPGALRVWITLLTLIDSKGYACAALPGLAIAACLPMDVVAKCLEVFEAPDPYSRTQAHEGRRLLKVERGWQVLNYEAMVERARHESAKARKRRWANDNYPAANDNDAEPSTDVHSRLVASNVVENVKNLDPSRSRSRSNFSSEGEAPLPPAPSDFVEDQALPPVVHTLEGRELSEELRSEAKLAGVKDVARWYSQLQQGPIGGRRGVLSHKVDDYVRSQFPKWRAWEEEETAKAQRAAATPPSSRFHPPQATLPPLVPEARHEAFALKYGVDLPFICKGIQDDVANGSFLPSTTRTRLQVLGERLTVAVKQLKAGHPVTGRLSREEALAWGPPPVGGNIPEVA